MERVSKFSVWGYLVGAVIGVAIMVAVSCSDDAPAPVVPEPKPDTVSVEEKPGKRKGQAEDLVDVAFEPVSALPEGVSFVHRVVSRLEQSETEGEPYTKVYLTFSIDRPEVRKRVWGERPERVEFSLDSRCVLELPPNYTSGDNRGRFTVGTLIPDRCGLSSVTFSIDPGPASLYTERDYQRMRNDPSLRGPGELRPDRYDTRDIEPFTYTASF